MKYYLQEKLLNFLIYIKMCLIRRLIWQPFIKNTHNPQKIQILLLKEILKQNRDTVFGKKYVFSNIDTYDDFRQAVPVQSYEDLRSYIEKQEETKVPYLVAKQPVMYALTSGTIGQPKFIPINEKTIINYKKSQELFACAQYSGIPSMYSGKILAIVGQSVEGYLRGGMPYGSMSGLLYKHMPGLIKSKYVIPSDIFEIKNHDLKYFIICAFGLSHKNITFLASANPSTLLKLSEIINSNFDMLIQIIETGSFKILDALPIVQQQTIERHFKKNANRARELKQLSKTHSHINLKEIWPNLKSVITWTSGSCSILIPKLKELLPNSTYIVEMGYLASEFRGNIVIDVLENNAVPAFHENFYEFVEKDDWENINQQFLTLDQISEGKQYYILVTTQGGLYRYFINDIIEVTGRYNNTPIIKFVQKGKGVTNITGEKLYEYQLQKAVELLMEKWDLIIDFFIMIADEDNLRYTLYVEHKPINNSDFSSLIESNLGKFNIEYKSKRDSGRLKPLHIVFVKPGTGEVYKKNCIKSGQRESQFKLICLQYKKDCSFDFSQFSYA